MSSVSSVSESDSYPETGSESLLSSPSESPVSEVAVAAINRQPSPVSSLRILLAHPVYDRSIWAHIAAYTPEVPQVFAGPENDLLFDAHFSAAQRADIREKRELTIQKLFQDPQNLRALNQSIETLSPLEIEAHLGQFDINAFRRFCNLAVEQNCSSILLALLTSNRIQDIPAVYLRGFLSVFGRLNSLNGIEACRTCARAQEFNACSVGIALCEAAKGDCRDALNALLDSPSFPKVPKDSMDEAFAIAAEGNSLSVVQALIASPNFHSVETETLIYCLFRAEKRGSSAIAAAILATNRLPPLRHSV